MIAIILAAILAVQAAPAVSQQPARGAIAGVVVNGATGDPLPNVRVTVARIDVSKTTLSALAGLVGAGDPAGGPPAEITMPAEFFDMMKKQMAMVQREMEAARKSGLGDIPDDAFPPEMAILKDLPIDDIHSVLVDPSGKLALVSKSAPPAVSDGAGRFRFQNLEPGLYRLIFSANGFVRQDYGQRAAGSGTPVVVESGRSRDDLSMRMTPVGALSGRLTDNSGQPLAGIPVQLLRVAYDATGKQKAKTIASKQTNDRGEYRFYYLTPGRYTVQAGHPASAKSIEEEIGDDPVAILTGERVAPNPNQIDERYTQVYYPGTTDPTAAGQVEAPAGSEVSGIDLVLALQRSFRVRGRIVDPRSGEPPRQANIRLTNPEGTSGLSGLSGFGQDQFYDPSDGSFDLRSVPAGSYVLNVDLPNPTPNRAGGRGEAAAVRNMSPAEQQAYYQARAEAQIAEQAAIPRIVAPITVNSDIDGLTLAAVLGTSLSGRVRIEPAGVGGIRLEQIPIELRALTADGTPVEGYDNSVRVGRSARPDGTFQLQGILPGRYGLRRTGLPPGFYLKSARMGETDVLNGAVTLPLRDTNDVLDIVISHNTGQIDGKATSADGRALPGAQVVLIPDSNRNRYELYRSVTADAEGEFTIPDVVPGEYRLAAWSWLEPFAYFDPTVMRQAEENGKAVRVGESSKQAVNVQTIVAPDKP